MSGPPQDVTVIDTLMWGHEGMTAAFLVEAERPALVDTGSRTSFETVRSALEARGLGPEDLEWIVLTHIHLDHCGASGDLAAAFPRARVVVHRRGARHLADPGRLVAGSAAVYGEGFHRYGDLLAVEESRIDVAEDGHRVDLGGGRHLTTIEAPGHARHQNAYLDSQSGALFGGDALGMEFHGGQLFPALPPPDVDVEAGLSSAKAIADARPTAIGVGHFGWVRDPEAAPERAQDIWRAVGEAGRSGWRSGSDLASVTEAFEGVLPSSALLSARGLELILELGWLDHTYAGLAAWAEADAAE